MPEQVPIRPDGLQIEEHRHFQNMFWTVQRFAWGAFLLIALITATGLAGRGGTLAQGHAFLGTAEVTWPRITRRGVPETLTILLPATTQSPEITLGDDLQRLFQIETISPRPASESGGAPLRLAFFPDRGAPHALRLSLRSQQSGLARYVIGTATGSITLTTLVLP